MIRHELQISHLRFYKTESTDPFQTYDAICTIVWEKPDVIWIKGFHGQLSRQLLRELVKFFVDNKITKVKAHRSLSKNLPFIAFRDGEYTEMLVEDMKKYALKVVPQEGL